MFYAFDHDNSGVISCPELISMSAKMFPDTKPDEMNELFAQFDVDGDGEISMHEFMHFYRSSWGAQDDESSASQLQMLVGDLDVI